MKNPLPPSLVAQWHPVLNEGLLASEASSGSAKKAWWIVVMLGRLLLRLG
jgi:hypothetical protein